MHTDLEVGLGYDHGIKLQLWAGEPSWGQRLLLPLKVQIREPVSPLKLPLLPWVASSPITPGPQSNCHLQLVIEETEPQKVHL